MNNESLETHKLPIQSQINIYTDGSKTEKHAGAGYIIKEGINTLTESSIRLSYNTTVFQAKIIAIREATNCIVLYCI